jgi:hypothetical protein
MNTASPIVLPPSPFQNIKAFNMALSRVASLSKLDLTVSFHQIYAH